VINRKPFAGITLRWLLLPLLLAGTWPAHGQSGLVGWWKFDEGTGTTTADSSTYGNSGTLVNGPVWATGRVGPGALTFNGTTSYVNVPNTSGSLDNLQFTGMTVAAWIKASAASGRIMEKGGWFFSAATSGGSNVVRFTVNDTGGYQNSTAISLNTWIHVAATWSWNSTLKTSSIHLFVNGVAADGGSPNPDSGLVQPNDIGVAWIGNRGSDAARGFNGTIDDVRVYNRTLTAAEIQALADSTAPGAPSGLTATAASSAQINLTWTAATDNVAVTGYMIERCQGASCSNFTQIGAPAGTAYNDTGLSPSTSYSYRVRAVDAAGNTGVYSGTASATTQSGSDTSPPSVPTGLASPASSESQINLTWVASTDNVGVAGYLIERCLTSACTFGQIATSTAASYIDTSVSAATSYNYRVRAKDAIGNFSTYSNPITAVASAAAQYPCISTGPAIVCYFYDDAGRLRVVQHDDGARQTYILDPSGNRLSTAGTSAAPVDQPTGLTVLPLSATSMSLAWNAPKGGGNGQYTYTVYRFGQFLKTVATNSTTDAQLEPHKNYSYSVSATDSAGNPSGQTQAVSNTTYANPVITSFAATTRSSTSIALSWSATDTDGPGGALTYALTRGSTPVSGCSTNSCTDSSLTADSPYNYTLTVTDRVADPTTATASARTYTNVVIGSFTATAASSNSITLAWSASGGAPGGLTYSVTRASASGPVSVPGCTTSPCTDSGLSGGTPYTYTLTATDSTGLDQATTTAGATTLPGVPNVPAHLHASPGISPDGNYSVIWDASTGAAAAYYNLKEGSGPTYVINAPTTAMGFNKPVVTGNTYTYQVQACASASLCSAYSGTATVLICRNGVCP